MTGAEALAYLQRRLAEYGLAVEDGRTEELYDYITEGRDELLRVFADAAPIVVRSKLTLELQSGEAVVWQFPTGTRDPFRVLAVYDTGSGCELRPAAQLEFDNGQYQWDNVRTLRLSRFAGLTGAPGVDVVLSGAAIDETTVENAWGLPATCHRAAAKWAAVLALTADEANDAKAAQALYAREIDQLSRLYGDYDANGGLALREALMASMGEYYGDSIY